MSSSDTPTTLPSWPNGARAAIALTIDNMGEAADLDRNLWPQAQPIGSHFSVTEVLRKFLAILAEYDISATYFVEAWNFGVYPDAIQGIAAKTHEVAWHAWRHEAWSNLQDEDAERANFNRSFGEEGLASFSGNGGLGQSAGELYKGFRPPGGVVHGERTLKMCREYGIDYISPAGHEAALVPLHAGEDSIVVLPFRWTTVDAYYYMETFSGLRKIKGDPEEIQSEQSLTEKMIAQVDTAVLHGGYLSVLFHPFLNAAPERLQAFEAVISHLADLRGQGSIWLARCRDVQAWLEMKDGNPVHDTSYVTTRFSDAKCGS
ncbi:hypothetical protein Q7P37_009193 [Cladosporium fusiforme]